MNINIFYRREEDNLDDPTILDCVYRCYVDNDPRPMRIEFQIKKGIRNDPFFDFETHVRQVIQFSYEQAVRKEALN